MAICKDTTAIACINQSSTQSRMLDMDYGNKPSDHNYAYICNPAHLSACSEKIVAYIAGFVVYKLKKCQKKRSHCEQCITAV